MHSTSIAHIPKTNLLMDLLVWTRLFALNNRRKVRVALRLGPFTTCLGVLLLIAPAVQAASFSSVQSGAWDDTATWGGAGVPGSGDTVSINNGHTVTVSDSRGCGDLQVNGTLSIAATGDLTVSNATVTNNNTISGGGPLITQNSVHIDNNAAFSAPLQVNTGTMGTHGTYGAITVDSGATMTSSGGGIAATGNVTVNGTLSGLNDFFANNSAAGSALTIGSGGLISSASLFVSSETFTNDGSETSAATVQFRRGVAGPQTLSGSGSLSPSTVQISSNSTVQPGPGLAALTPGNFMIDAGSTLSLTNPLTLSGPVNLVFANNGTVSGTNSLITQNSVHIDNNATFDAPLQVNTGTMGTHGTFGAITVDSGATLTSSGGSIVANGNVTVNGTLSGVNDFFADNSAAGSTFTIGSGGLISITSLFISTETFTNDGSETSAGTVQFRHGATQTLSGSGSLSPSTVQISANSTVQPGPGLAALTPSNFTIDAGSTLSLTNPLTLSGPVNLVFANNGAVSGTGTLITQNSVHIDNNATFSAPLQVNTGTTATSGTYGAITVDSGATLTSSGGDIPANGNITVNGTLSGLNQFFANNSAAGSSLTIGSSGLISITALFISTETFTNDGSETSNGTVQFRRGATQTLSGSGSLSPNLVQVSSNSTLILGSNHQLSSLLIDSGSVMDLTGHNLSLSGAGTPVTNNGSFTTTGSTIVYNGAAGQNAQTVNNNWDYNNLTISNGAGVSLGTAESIPGTLTLTSGVFSIGSNLTMGNGSQIRRSDGSLSGTPAFGTSLNVEYFGSNPITSGSELPASSSILNDLIINNVAGVNLSSDEQVNGALTLTTGALSIGAHTFTLNGAISSGGGTLTGGGTSNITFAGSGSSTSLPAVQNGLNTLTINRANGISLGADLTVVGTLVLTSGDLTTGLSTLTMPNTATSSGTTDVVGNVKRTGFTAGVPLGFGNPFTSINFQSGTLPTDVNVNLTKAIPVGFAAAVARTYLITPNGNSGFMATLRLHYLDAELGSNTEGAALSLRRFNGTSWEEKPATAFDTTANWSENNAVTQFSPWTLSSSTPTAAPATIRGQITNADGTPLGGALVTLTGGRQVRRAITNAAGMYSFTNVDTGGFYTVTPQRANYLFSPGERSFTLLANKTDALFTGAQTMETANPLDTPEFFVRQHYLDFLNREPEQDGLDYWSGQLRQCAGNQRCVSSTRIGVSGAFFIEREFQQTGSFVYRLYKASLGRQPSYAEFSADRGKVVGGATLAEAQQAFADQWVSRDAFKQQYPDTMAAADFVNQLFDTAGLQAYNERRQQIDAMMSGKKRAAVLRDVIDIAEFRTREYNPSFVLMQYFGYLRRDVDHDGYNFWLDVVNDREPGNYRGMVCSFITSAEYQRRFSAVVTHSNSECGP